MTVPSNAIAFTCHLLPPFVGKKYARSAVVPNFYLNSVMTKRVAGAFIAVRYKVLYMAKQINFSHILYHNNKFTSTVVCYTFV